VIDWMEIWKETVKTLMIELQNKMVDMTYALLVDWKERAKAIVVGVNNYGRKYWRRLTSIDRNWNRLL
jgi:hypothetical protein